MSGTRRSSPSSRPSDPGPTRKPSSRTRGSSTTGAGSRFSTPVCRRSCSRRIGAVNGPPSCSTRATGLGLHARNGGSTRRPRATKPLPRRTRRRVDRNDERFYHRTSRRGRGGGNHVNTFADPLNRAVRIARDDEAVVDGHQRFTYGELEARCRRLVGRPARVRSRAGRPGRDPRGELAPVPRGLSRHPRRRPRLVPLNTRHAEPELEYTLRDSGARVLITDRDPGGLADAVEQRDLDPRRLRGAPRLGAVTPSSAPTSRATRSPVSSTRAGRRARRRA